ncbi:DUF3102 domain-containing protein [Desulfitobacterium sp. THU1]|uniref:DUF3102 domain-containing protein n=1 Tax=Desulfitobacterium sp. THU1 TaxID=3138072 RepID=UPI00311E8BEF
MDEWLTERTPLVIASEINIIKQQTGKILLAGAIEVGRRLKEARGLVPYGEWLKWLEESVNYSDRTAQQLMRIFTAYGGQQLTTADVTSQALPDLSYSQALILLGVPEEERAQFIAELDLESMTARELQKAVQERSKAIEERDQAVQETGVLSKTLEDQKGQIAKLTKELADLKLKSEGLSKSYAEAMTKAERLSLELKSQKEDTSAKAITRMSNNLIVAYHKAKANRIAFLYESIDTNFKELLRELKDFEQKEPDTFEAYKKKIVDFLTNGLKGQM